MLIENFTEKIKVIASNVEICFLTFPWYFGISFQNKPWEIMDFSRFHLYVLPDILGLLLLRIIKFPVSSAFIYRFYVGYETLIKPNYGRYQVTSIKYVLTDADINS